MIVNDSWDQRTIINYHDCLIGALVNYQREVDKGKLTAVANFEKLTFRA